MKYSVTNDKRNICECVLYLGACIVGALIEIYVLVPITIPNPIWNMVFNIIKPLIVIGPVGLVSLIKKVCSKILLYFCHIQNLSGKYEFKIDSNYKGGTISNGSLEIKHSFDEIEIYFQASNSKSRTISAQIDNSGKDIVLRYLYQNDGDGLDKANNKHEGTAVITFIGNEINGYFYNNGKDRKTYGTIKSINK